MVKGCVVIPFGKSTGETGNKSGRVTGNLIGAIAGVRQSEAKINRSGNAGNLIPSLVRIRPLVAGDRT